MRIAVCDDQQIFIDHVLDLLNRELGTDNHNVLDTFTSGEMLYSAHQQHGYHLIFLDIELGSGWNGMETAQRLRQLDREVMIIFLTSYGQYKDDAFDVTASQYLMKPIDEERFLKVLRRCQKNFYEKNFELLLNVVQETPVQMEREEVRSHILLVLPVREVLYVECYSPYLLLYTIDGACYRTTGSLTELAQQLQDYGMVLVHKSILVNLKYIQYVEKGYAYLGLKNQNIKKVEISRRRQKELEKQLMCFKLGRI